jgi:hypothetical protein
MYSIAIIKTSLLSVSAKTLRRGKSKHKLEVLANIGHLDLAFVQLHSSMADQNAIDRFCGYGMANIPTALTGTTQSQGPPSVRSEHSGWCMRTGVGTNAFRAGTTKSISEGITELTPI